MADVLCFGSLHFDILCHPLVALPPPGGIQPIEAIDFAFSGNAVNVAGLLRHLGMTTEIAGAGGNDMIGVLFLEALAQMGVGTTKIQRSPMIGTGTSVIAVAPDGERSISFTNGANESFDLATVPANWFDEVRVVVMSSVLLLPQLTGDAVRHVFQDSRVQSINRIFLTVDQ